MAEKYKWQWRAYVDEIKDNRLKKVLLKYRSGGRRDVFRPEGRWCGMW